MKHRPQEHRSTGRSAFTLIELLVVLALIGALAALTAPALKGFGQSNAFTAGQRQLVDDLKYARQMAIRNRATVFMVFAPTNAWNHQATFLGLNAGTFGSFREEALNSLTNVAFGQYSSYAIYTQRRLGEQPGVDRPRYLTEWRSLPQGVIFPREMFAGAETPGGPVVTNRPHHLPLRRFPFPLVLPGAQLTAHYTGPTAIWPNLNNLPLLPFIAFDPSGRISDLTYAGLTDARGNPVFAGSDLVVGVGPGSVFLPRQADGQPRPGPVDVVEAPRYGYTNGLIRISYYTGRARLVRNLPQ